MQIYSFSAPTDMMLSNRDGPIEDLLGTDAEKLKQSGKEAEYYEIEDAGHGGPAFWGSEVLNIVEKFVRRNCN